MIRIYLTPEGKPFSDGDAARIKAQTMAVELGRPFVVVPHRDGYGVVCDTENPPTVEREEQGQFDVPPSPIEELLSQGPHEPAVAEQQGEGDRYRQHVQAQAPEEGEREELSFHPSPRAFLHLFLLAGVGALMIAMASWPINYLQQEFGLHFSIEDTAYLVWIISLLGLALGVYGLGAFAWAYVSNVYRVSADLIVKEVGLIARKTSEVHPRDIRSISVEQNVLQRLLGVGDVHFATAGTGDYDLVMRHIAAPAWVRDQIYRLVRNQMANPD